jgi:hypothetical protein
LAGSGFQLPITNYHFGTVWHCFSFNWQWFFFYAGDNLLISAILNKLGREGRTAVTSEIGDWKPGNCLDMKGTWRW